MGINCLLISTNRVEVPFPVYPLGVAYLMGALRDSGHQASHYDLLAQGGLAGIPARIEEFRPDLIGLSIRNLDTVDSTAPDAFMDGVVEVVEFLRHHTSVPLVLGGPAFSIMPEIIMDLLKADYGVIGEGEKVLPELADMLAAGQVPAEKIMRAKTGDTLWRPALYDSQTAEHYLARGGMLNVQTKRGCPYRCSYCSYPLLEGRGYRFRDPDEVAEDVIRLGRDYGAGYVFFTDSVFNDIQDHYLQVCESLIRSGNTTPWCGYFRPQNLTAEGMALMKRAGLAAMEFGTDASCDRTLSGMQKGFTFSEVVQCNDLAVEHGVPCAHFIIFGGPDENRDTLAEGLNNVEALRQTVVFAFTGIRVLPGTAMFQRAIDDGVMQEGQPLLEPFFYFSPHLSEQELDAALKGAWKGRLDRIYPSSVMQERVTRLHSKGHVGPMWDMLVRHH
ncbi:MAG: cobalamin-dependent protein [Proteobacteria bacterium]|nr:cobalamin-dependent protein [Pseudomonadota bacterium]MBU1739163.1 cobalamin-dependent protein [Pseudomonadota bacterium]